jgi:hypothetical protein
MPDPGRSQVTSVGPMLRSGPADAAARRCARLTPSACIAANRSRTRTPSNACNAKRAPAGSATKYAQSVSSGFPRWWRLGLAGTEVVLAAGLIVAAVTEGGWYWWAGAIAAATLALINLSVYLRTERKRCRPPDP